jgi:hypothetical protein
MPPIAYNLSVRAAVPGKWELRSFGQNVADLTGKFLQVATVDYSPSSRPAVRRCRVVQWFAVGNFVAHEVISIERPLC